MLMMTSCFVDHVLVELHGIEGHFFAAYNTFLHFDLKCPRNTEQFIPVTSNGKLNDVKCHRHFNLSVKNISYLPHPCTEIVRSKV